MKLSMKISTQNLVISKSYWSLEIGAAYNECAIHYYSNRNN